MKEETKSTVRLMTWSEQIQWVMSHTDVEWENLYIVEEAAKASTPTMIRTTITNDKTEITYE